MSDDIEEKRTGYGRPPVHSRFKPGSSGNAKGRPKKSRNIATEILAELNLPIVVRENGREQKLSKGAVLAKTLVSRALNGDIRAFKILVDLLPAQFQVPSDAKPTEPVNAEDAEILERFFTRRLLTENEAAPSAQHESDNENPENENE
ncbi:DUF5681 domain-containing protein [Mesorhizobium shangrilense]|uniref:DUF5681 domain-containing protein n=1 Tax=Mesorhizobium shangrilense TaxID=460060 RepID=A0ABV2DH17_9HYPH